MFPLIRSFLIAAATILALYRLTGRDLLDLWSLSQHIVGLTVTQLAAYLVYVWLIFPKLISPLRYLPGPKGGSFFMGHFLQNLKEPPGRAFQRWVAEVPNEGLICYQDFFNSLRVLPTSPAALADVLVHKNYDFEKPAPLRKGISRILGMGMFLAEGEEHKRQRRTMMPAFSFRHIKTLYPVFWAKSNALIDAISKQLELQQTVSFEAHEWASRATLDIIGVAGMGQDFNALDDPDNTLNRTYRKIFTPSRWGQLLGLLGGILPVWVVRNLPIQRNDDVKNASDLIRRTCFQLISQKKIAMKKGTSGTDILSVALSSGGFTDEDLVNQMMTFLAAGHETTASALTWAIYNVGKYPGIQSRLRDEINGRLGPQLAGDETITSEVIDNMPYLQAFCQEVLRLYPPVPVTIREAVVDTTILDIPIPKGTTIILSPWAINTSGQLWGPDAQSFDPNRWLRSPAGGARSNFSFLTFLHGPRSCIGQKFAMAEFACLVACWVGSFQTKLLDETKEVEIRGGITMKPKNGLRVLIEKVEVAGRAKSAET